MNPVAQKVRLIVLLSNRMTSGIHAQGVRIHVRTRRMQKCKYKTIKRQKKKNTSVGDETPNLQV